MSAVPARPVSRDDPWEIDVVENAAQFVGVVAVAALVGTAEVLRSIRCRIL
jgi:hypothetical protein